MKNTVIFGGIGFIFSALCVVLSYSKNEQTLQVSKETYSLERNEGHPFYVNIMCSTGTGRGHGRTSVSGRV